MELEDNYSDIIHHQRPEQPFHERMSIEKRAAQFAPFAALTGFETAVAETARTTQSETLLSDNEQEKLNIALNEILSLPQQPIVQIIHFIPDGIKSGGTYACTTTRELSLDNTKQYLIADKNNYIYLKNIIRIRKISSNKK